MLEEHLKSRHFDVNLHTAWMDHEDRSVTFPVWNLSGELVGYQRYRPDGDRTKFNNPKEGRYYTYSVKGKRGVWGLESWRLSNTLFITEGVFDASRLTWEGFSAICVMSNDPGKTMRNWLWTVSQSRPVVAVCDGDKAGIKLAKYGTSFQVMPDGMDMGDASDYYVEKFLRGYD